MNILTYPTDFTEYRPIKNHSPKTQLEVGMDLRTAKALFPIHIKLQKSHVCGKSGIVKEHVYEQAPVIYSGHGLKSTGSVHKTLYFCWNKLFSNVSFFVRFYCCKLSRK